MHEKLPDAASSACRPVYCDALSIVVPTRDRGKTVLHTIQSILSSDYLPAQILVVDQSCDDQTELAMRKFQQEPLVVYCRTSSRGLSAALNDGIKLVNTPCVAITGDDCLLGPNFVYGFIEFFQRHAGAALVFGSILPNPAPQSVTFSPHYTVPEDVLVKSLLGKHRIGGTSACMAIRKQAWEL